MITEQAKKTFLLQIIKSLLKIKQIKKSTSRFKHCRVCDTRQLIYCNMKHKLVLLAFGFLAIFTAFVNNAIGDNAKTVVVSEIAWMGTKASSRDEWLELYNNSDLPIDLTGWILKTSDDGLNIKLQDFIPVKSFYLIERNDDEVIKDVKADLIASFGNGLSNDGEKLELYDSVGQLVDFVDASGGWPQGKASSDYKTMEKINLAGFADAANWKTNDGVIINGVDAEDNSIQGTPVGSTNTPISFNSNESLTSNNDSYTDVFISEILPNPQGSDKESEFIEFYNKNSEPIDLKDWSLEDESKSQYKIKNKDFNFIIIPANGYFVIYRKQSNIALNNSNGDSLKLFNPQGDLIDSVIYKDKADEQKSFNRDFSDVSPTPPKWEWSSTLTPGAINIITSLNQSPQANFSFSQDGVKFIFDASDSFDPENNPLAYSWDFGDGEKGVSEIIEHKYSKAGKYTIVLEVSDGANTSNESRLIIFEDAERDISYSDGIIINEFFPNPVGSDLVNEWIELYNKGNQEVDLEGWQIGDLAKNDKPYVIPQGVKIPPGVFLVLKREQTGIAINNNGDGIKLFQPNQNIIDSVVFNEKAPEGLTFNRKPDGSWGWSEKITSGAANVIELRLENKKEDTPKAKDNSKAKNSAVKVNKKEKPISLTADKKIEPKTSAGDIKEKKSLALTSVASTAKQNSPFQSDTEIFNNRGDLNPPLDASISSMVNNKNSMIIFVAITLAGFVGSITGAVFGRKLKV